MTAPYYVDDSVTVYHGDCLDILAELPDASVDAVVTDPPYGLEFMGREWDSFKPASSHARARTERADAAGAPFQAWCEQWATECLRVLKPGGHLLAFGGTRTWHRLACAVEDAGFEIRDSIAWLYGSGFPKSLDVSKAIDKADGIWRGRAGAVASTNGSMSGGNYERADKGAPATDGARTWAGWGTALKPAFEPIVVARKPLAAGTVAANVLQHGTGALNIDACRVGTDELSAHGGGVNGAGRTYGNGLGIPALAAGSNPHVGRWPANVTLDPTQAAELDRQSGTSASRIGNPRGAASGNGWGMTATGAEYDDQGGASRFFPTFHYEPKAPTHERPRVKSNGSDARTTFTGKVCTCSTCGKRYPSPTEMSCGHDGHTYEPILDRPEATGHTAHPTVKPLDLMRWLVRLVTPPAGTVLDPFAGSGTTAEACIVEGFSCITIEREADYLPLIVARLTKPIQVSLFGDEPA